MNIKDIYIVDTIRGKCPCLDVGGKYMPLKYYDSDFIGEEILNVEQQPYIQEWEQLEFNWYYKEKE